MRLGGGELGVCFSVCVWGGGNGRVSHSCRMASDFPSAELEQFGKNSPPFSKAEIK